MSLMDFLIGAISFTVATLGVLNIIFVKKFRDDFKQVQQDFKDLCASVETLAADLEEFKKN